MKDLIERLISAGIDPPDAKQEILILKKEFKDKNKIIEVVNERIETRRPIQYILGKAYFMDFVVDVNETVLIPRPETELLVEETIKRLSAKRHCEEAELVEADEAIQHKVLSQGVETTKGSDYVNRSLTSLGTIPEVSDCHASLHSARNDVLRILDIGTGTGIIPIALAKALPESRITTIDINKKIIELAKKNALKNNVSEKINFKICDVFTDCFEGLIEEGKFDLIISNPPYVKDENIKSLSPEVQHEPKEALIGSKENKSGLIYYERILQICHGINMIAFEIDPSLVKDLKSLMAKYKIEKYEIVKDYSKLDRFLFIYS